MPWAIAVSRPTCLAMSSSQWIGFRSPETPAQLSRSPGVGVINFVGGWASTFTESNQLHGIHEALLCLVAEHGDECQRRQQLVVAQFRGSLLLEERGVVVLDRVRVLADLLPTDLVIVGMPIVHPDDLVGQSHGW